ncbi:RNA polymerase sigma factor [Marinicrinis lubricantis]|uniref:RNA polymerase sigma factor n=1 Tax=Marinicrinis lubricantis TaxID=2086470 RepID=A0ABW1IJI3_9BACL
MDSNANCEYLRYISDTADPKEVLRELMIQYGNDVWNYAYSMTRKWEVADDISQEVFIKVYKNLFTFRNEASVKTWLLKITRNTVLDYKKSAFFRRVTLVDYISAKGTESSAEAEVIEKMAVNDIWKQVLKLPPKYREVLILYGHYQLSMREIADLLGVSEGTVKSRLHHARAKVIKLKESEIHGSA